MTSWQQAQSEIRQHGKTGSPVLFIFCFVASCLLFFTFPDHVSATKSSGYEILVHAGEVEKSVDYFKSRNFWGKDRHDKDLDVPRIILAVASKRWEEQSRKVTVEVKKELFYRIILPLVLLSNELIMEERDELEAIGDTLKNGKTLSPAEQARLQEIANRYGLEDVEESFQGVETLLERVDSIPPSLALGQTAYESGYGTSRFAVEGNALFGQWTYSVKGMKPKEHRASKGNYGVAAYDWPFDSVTSYMLNLNSHRAYQKLRDKRTALRKQGKEVTGPLLADTLDRYSERGMAYVKTLKSIIRVNNLAVADKARLRDEKITLLVGVESAEKIEETEARVDKLRESGELDRIVKEMRLDSRE